MSARRARWLWAALIVAACRPSGPPLVTGARLPREEPAVRIGVMVDTTVVAVTSDAELELTTLGGERVARGNAREAWTFSADARARVEVRNTRGERLGPFDAPLLVRPRAAAAVVMGGVSYRGAALVRAARPGRVTAANVLELEDYLLGVVPLEIGNRPEAELEAVKAQAVAARTYAIGFLGRRDSLGFDFLATDQDQVYGGLAKEDPVATRAVRATAGEILTHAGRPILAYYHSTCGGRTAAVDEVWRRAPLPYLRSVEDRNPRTGRAYCEISNRFRWSVTWSGEELRTILARTLSAHTRARVEVSSVEALEVRDRTRSERVGTLRVRVDGRSYEIRGDSARWVLRPEPGRILNSTRFELDAERAGGTLTRLIARGGGWGHGVGMCQVGAWGRARAGQKYRDILRAYYRDTKLVRLY